MSKIKDIKPRIMLATGILPLALMLAFIPENKTVPYKISIEDLVTEITDGAQYFTADQIADYIVQQDPSIQLIDVRSKDEFDTYHLPGAINIPLADILSEEWRYYLDQDVRTNVLYANGTVTSNQAWLICTQRGFKNNYVLQGGLNYWAEVILNPELPAATAPSDEFARYDFRKAMSAALGGGSLESTKPVQTESATALPAIQTKPKKKKAAGGC